MSLEHEIYHHEGGTHQPVGRMTPPSSGKEVRSSPQVAAIDLQLQTWYQFKPEGPFEMVTQKLNIQRFLNIKRTIAECEAKGWEYELLCNGSTYQIRLKGDNNG